MAVFFSVNMALFAGDNSPKMARAPQAFLNASVFVEGRLDLPVTDLKLEISRIADDVFIDPPVEASCFDRYATVTVLLSGGYYHEEY